MQEKQNIEWKESWRDEYLKWICGFANAQGGEIYIGKNDKGEIVGIENTKRLMDDLPNKIVTNLGIICDINLFSENGKVTNTNVQKICKVSKRTASRYLADLEQKYIEKEGGTGKGTFYVLKGSLE